MSPLDAALSDPDESVSCRKLYELCSSLQDVFTSASLALSAAKYFRAFCDARGPPKQRRYTGMVLSRMLQAAPTVIDHCQPSYHRLGAVLLLETESEVTKIIAGIIIRQVLAHSVPFARLSTSEKMSKTAPLFPQIYKDDWMQKFQTYLDELEKAGLIKPLAKPCILFAVALHASDGLSKFSDGSIVVVLQDHTLTCIVPNTSAQSLEFVDIPVQHIASVELQRSTLYDSQSRTMEHDPWEVVLSLSAKQWMYELNATKRLGAKIRIIFGRHGDAKECMHNVKEIQTRQTPKGAKLGNSEQLYGGEHSEDELQSAVVPGANRPFRYNTTQANSLRPSQDEAIIISSSTPPSSSDYTGEEVEGETALNRPLSSRGRPAELSPTPSMKKACSLISLSASGISGPVETKLNRPKPKALELLMNDIGDEDGPVGPAQDGSTRPKFINGTASLTTTSPQAVEKKRGAKATSKPCQPLKVLQPALPRSQNADEGTSESRKTSEADVFAIPADDDSQSSKRVKQKVVTVGIPVDEGPQEISHTKRETAENKNYNEIQTSPDGDSGSEYAASKKRRVHSVSKPAGRQKRVSVPAQTALNKVNGPKGRISKPSVSKSVSTKKHPDMAGLSTSQPIASARSKLFKSVPIRKTLSQPDIQAQGQLLPNGQSSEPNHCDLNIEMENSTAGDDVQEVEMSNDPSFVVHGKRTTPRDLVKKEHVSPKMVPSKRVEDQTPPEIKPSAGRKRRAEKTPPSTPHAKRFRPMSKQVPPSGGAAVVIENTPVLVNNQPRLLEDPGSPCNEANRVRRKIPPREVSVGNLLGSMDDADNAKMNPQKTIGSENTQAVVETARKTRFTPTQLAVQRTIVSGPGNAEMLSSNSKPLPASPHADSTAISGLADSAEVDMIKRIGLVQTANSNPFSCPSQPAVSAFLRRLMQNPVVEDEPHTADTFPPAPAKESSLQVVNTALRRVDSTGQNSSSTLPPIGPYHHKKATTPGTANIMTQKPLVTFLPIQPYSRKTTSRSAATVRFQDEKRADLSDPLENISTQVVNDTHVIGAAYEGSMDVEGDTTLVADEHNKPAATKDALAPFRSSPPDGSSPSSHSSTSAEPTSDEESPSSFPESQAEEMEWEAALDPHQRSLHDQLIRISKRIARHVVDSETAVTDIIAQYGADGMALLTKFEQRNTGQFTHVIEDVSRKKALMKQELLKFARNMLIARKTFAVGAA